MARITSFSPGQSPPHVTMPQASVDGSKKSRSRGPAHSIAGGSSPELPEAPQIVQRRRVKDALVILDEAHA